MISSPGIIVCCCFKTFIVISRSRDNCLLVSDDLYCISLIFWSLISTLCSQISARPGPAKLWNLIIRRKTRDFWMACGALAFGTPFLRIPAWPCNALKSDSLNSWINKNASVLNALGLLRFGITLLRIQDWLCKALESHSSKTGMKGKQTSFGWLRVYIYIWDIIPNDPPLGMQSSGI